MIELTRFRLKDGQDVEAFLLINAEYQTQFVYMQPGLLRRTVAPGLDGAWVSITMWRAKVDVHRADDAKNESPVAAAFYECVNPRSTTTEYFKELPG